MSTVATRLAALLPQPMPEGAADRLLLFAFRRMGAHGLHDAPAAQAFLTAFGVQFRRPLVALRSFMADLSSISTSPLRIAPSCCCRVTGAEAAVLALLARVEHQPEAAVLLLADLAGTQAVEGAFASAALLSASFADLGLPFSER